MADLNPCTELNTLYSKLKTASLPVYVVSVVQDASVDQSRKCVLTCPACKPNDGGFEAQSFFGFGRNKKMAQRDAACAALEFLRGKVGDLIMENERSMWEAIKAVFSESGMRHDPVFQGYLYICHRCLDGWVPLGLILTSRELKKDIRRWKTECNFTGSAQEMVTQILEDLIKAGKGKGDDSMEVDGLNFRSKVALRFFDDMEERLIEGVHEQETDIEAVLVPHELRAAVTNHHIPTDTSILSSVANVLQIEKSSLVSLGRAGPVVRSASLTHSKEIQSMDRKEGDSMEFAIQAHSKSGAQFEVELKEPNVWVAHCQTNAENVNERASWFVGKPVYGDAVLTLCRPSMGGNDDDNLVRMKWRSYTVKNFWQGICWKLPETRYAVGIKSQIIAKLPNSFRTYKSWPGSYPCDLLRNYCISFGLPSPKFEVMQSENGEKKICECRLEQPFDRGAEIKERSSPCKKDDHAKQQAALKVLHKLLPRDIAHFTPPSQINTHTNNTIFKLYEPGDQFRPKICKGMRINMSYTLYGGLGKKNDGVDLGGGSVIVESRRAFKFDAGDGGILQCIDNAVMGLHEGAKGEMRFEGALEGTDHFGAFDRIPMLLKFEIVTARNIITADIIGMFIPPLGNQRYSFAATPIIQHNATSVLDIGCGAARFLEHLVKENPPSLGPLIGIDISRSALKHGKNALKRILGINEDKNEPKNDPKNDVTLYYGNVLCGDGLKKENLAGLVNVDAVSMVEVVEHLDPEPLSHVGEVVLGIVKPRLFVVTTPNWDYNIVIRKLGGCSDGPPDRLGFPMRCNDHRFEWTRAEFQQWAMQLADKFSYTVSFDEVGEAVKECSVLDEENLKKEDVGKATQMAVFLRIGETTGENKNGNHEEIPFFEKYWNSKDISSEDHSQTLDSGEDDFEEDAHF